jgi:hypothetical protein
MRAVLALALLSALPAAAQLPPDDPHRPIPRVDLQPPAVPPLRNGVLIFSKTNGYRHVEQIPRAVAVITDLARAQQRRVFATENAAVFRPDLLTRFRVIVLASSSGDAYTPDQRAAFRAWIERGGRVVALHAAGGDSSYAWPFYRDRIIGAQFIGHPGGTNQFQAAEVSLPKPGHPILRGVRMPWRPVDEWYSFDRVPGPPDATVVATIDERSYRPEPRQIMGAVHPIAWINTVGRGQVFYSALGHQAQSYDDPNHRRIIANALRWASQR